MKRVGKVWETCRNGMNRSESDRKQIGKGYELVGNDMNGWEMIWKV